MAKTTSTSGFLDEILHELLEARKVFLSEEIDMRRANTIIAQLLYLESRDSKAPISLYVNSPGGELSSGLAIYDVIKSLQPPVATLCTGLAASAATLVLAGGEKGQRKAYPNSTILIHQPLGGVWGQASDIDIHAREILRLKESVNRILSSDTGQPLRKIEKDTNRDCWMTAKEALEYGIVDEVL